MTKKTAVLTPKIVSKRLSSTNGVLVSDILESSLSWVLMKIRKIIVANEAGKFNTLKVVNNACVKFLHEICSIWDFMIFAKIAIIC